MLQVLTSNLLEYLKEWAIYLFVQSGMRLARRVPKGVNMTKLFLTTAAVLALAGAAHAAPTVSAADNDVATKVVSTQGVNFNDPAEARSFYFKLQTAAQLVCQSGSADHLVAGTEDLSCIRDNMNAAVGKVDAPQLTAMLNGNAGTSRNGSAFAADAR
jgi:UrcA family protein